MPLEKIVTMGTRAWALWKITESEDELSRRIHHPDQIPLNISNSGKRLEWLTGRLVTQCLLEEFGLPFKGIVKDGYGKPSPAGYPFRLSLSHSFPYVAAILDKENEVGIDVEEPKEKLLRVAPRVLSQSELSDAGTDLVKHCIYWCAKETLIKVYGKKDLVFAENLHIDPFNLQVEGFIIGRIIVIQQVRLIPLYYRVYAGFVLTFSLPGLPDEQPGPNFTT